MSPADRAEVSPAWLAQLRTAEPTPWTHLFAMVERATGAPVGGCGYKGPPDAEGVVEIAYGVDTEHRGRGFAKEAAAALVDYAFGTGVRVVRAHTRLENGASGRVLAASGFTPVGEVMDPEDGLVQRWELATTGRGRDMSEMTFAVEPDLAAPEFVDVLRRSTLAERRPIDDETIMRGMVARADVIATARDKTGLLVGVSRALTDFHYCTYVADLAVDVAFQGRGIGRELIRRTHVAAGLGTYLVLLAAPKAETYYPHIGMRRHESCWFLDRQRKTP